MKQTQINNRLVLEADEGMIITDDCIFGKIVYPADGADISIFREITEKEYHNNSGME